MIKLHSLLLVISVLSFLGGTTVHSQSDSLSDVGSYSEDARTARIAQLRQQYRITLSDTERLQVIANCERAQSNLSKISSRLLTTKQARKTTYNSVVGTLTSLRVLVSARAIDTSNIELLTVDYQQEQAQFDNAVTAYELALSDSISITCTSNPEDFRAALEGVRGARKNVVAVSADIEELTKSNLKTTFDSTKTRLVDTKGKNGN